MSKSIDERVVQMEFDNARFEKNVSTSMSTIEQLKKSLNFDKSTKSFDSLTSASKNVNFSGITNAVDAASVKFSALQVAGVTALANIANQAVNTGKRLISSLTVDPVKLGLDEYETQINAIQTIMANTSSKGTTLDQVNSALDELNHYADMTIYNFTEMTRNIGTFTAAGVGLNQSVSAIKGIANLAAVSGSTSYQASTAMYQLSQALAAGTVKLQDWNSVVNAGMGGEVFQSALKDTARVHGVAIDDMIKKEGSFRETLKDGWITTSVLTETLAKFTGDLSAEQLKAIGYTDDQVAAIIKMGQTANDAATKVKTFTQLIDTLREAAQSGWTQSWQIVIGNFDQAKSLFSEASDSLGALINESANARNALLTNGLMGEWDKFASEWTKTMGSGVAGVESYKDIIKSVATEQGVQIDSMIQDMGSFENTLKSGWLTSDIMKESIGQLAKKMSGLSEKELQASGYTKEHVDALNTLNEEVQNGSISMEQFAGDMTKMSGRENLIVSLKNTFKALFSVVNPIKEALHDIFPPVTAKQLYNITTGLKNLTENLILSETQSNNLKRTFKGVFAIIDIGTQAFSSIIKAITPLTSIFSKTGDGVLGLTANFGDWLVALDDTIKQTDVFGNAAQTVADVIEYISTSVSNFMKKLDIKYSFPGLTILQGLIDRSATRMDNLGQVAENMDKVVSLSIEKIGEAAINSNFVKAFTILWSGVQIASKGIVTALGNLITGIAKTVSQADFSNVFDTINTLSLSGIAIGITKFLHSLSKPLDGVSGILDGVTGILDGVRGSFEAYQTQLKAGTLMKIATAIGILTAAIVVISLIDSNKLAASLGSISVLFGNLLGSMAIFGKISGDVSGVIKTSGLMITMSVSILLLATALKKIGDLDVGQMVTGLVGIIGLTTTMVAASKIMGSGSSTIIKGAAQMVIFAVAIKVLASACKDLSTLSWGELTKGLVGVGILLAEVSIFLNTAKFSGKSITTAAGIVILAGAIKILASSVETFGQMNWTEIGKGLTAIGVLLAEIAIFTNLTGNAKHVIATGVSLIAIGAALKIFASAVSDMAGMSWDELGRGLTGVGVALLAVTVALNLMPKNMISTGVGLIAVSAALLIMSASLSKMGSLSWEEIAKGLTVLAGAMLILAISLNVMNGTLAGSAALLIASAALSVLAPVLGLFGNMSWESIAKGLVVLAGAFAIIGVAGLLLTPIVPAILALAGSIALIGVGVLAIGTGLLAAGTGLSALAIGFTALAAAGVAGATATVAALTVIITGVAALIPEVLTKLGEGIIAFARVIATGGPEILNAITTILLSIIQAVGKVAPELINVFGLLLAELVETVAEYTPRIVDATIDILMAILDGIEDATPKIIDAAVNIVSAFLIGIGKAIPELVDAGAKMIIEFINGTADAIRNNTPELIDAMHNLADAMVESMILFFKGTGLDRFVEAGKNVVEGFIKGIKETFSSVANVGAELGSNVLTAIKTRLGIHSPSKETGALGQFSGLGFVDGLVSTFGNVKKAGTQLGDDSMTGISDGIESGSKKAKKSAKKAAKSLYDIAKEWIDEENYYKRISLEDELSKWEEVQAKYKAGTEERKKIDREVYRVREEMITRDFNNEKEFIEDERYFKRKSLNDELDYWIAIQEKYNALGDEYDAQRLEADKKVFQLREDVLADAYSKEKEFIDDKKYYGQLSLSEELAYWKGIQGQFIAGSEQRKNASKEVYRVEKELMKEAFENAKQWIDDRKYYDDLSLSEELYAYEQFRDAYEEGSEERIALDREVYRVEKEISKAREAHEKEMADLQTETTEKRIALEQEYYDKTKEVNEQLKQDIESVNKQYEDAVESRAKTIANSYNLWDYAKMGQGVDGQVLLDNLGSQLTAMEDWQKDINGLADRGIAPELLTDLRNMGPSAASEVKALNSLTDEQLVQYVTMWQQRQQMAKDQALLELEDMKKQSTDKIAELTNAANAKLNEYKTAWDTQLADLNAKAAARLTELQNAFDEQIGSLSRETRRKVRELTSDIEDAIDVHSEQVTGQMVDLTQNIQTAMETPDWVSIGTNIIAGIQKGITDKARELAETAARVAREALEAAEEALDINSPSGEFRDVGMYCDLGFINGLKAYSSKVNDQAADVGKQATEAISNSFDPIWALIDDETDYTPTIKPVMDLSNVTSGMSMVGAMFSRNQALAVDGIVNQSLASKNQNGITGPQIINQKYEFNQTNQSPKALSRVDIYRETHNLFAGMERTVKP